MLVDSKGKFITARTYPQLARVQTSINDDRLTISVAGKESLRISLQPESEEALSVRVWSDTVEAMPVGEPADLWFSEFLKTDCKLVYQANQFKRGVDLDYGEPEDEVSFADGFPLLVISQASLEDLNSRLDTTVTMQHFRPNLVVEGSEAYAEDHWSKIKIGEIEFVGVKNCSRCVMTTVDPETGEKDAHSEPLKTLGSYRRTGPGKILFGQNLIPRSTGVIRVGDPLTLIP